MASETVDQIDWSHPPPSWAVPPERLVHSINECNISGTKTCNRSMQGNHLAYAATQGITRLELYPNPTNWINPYLVRTFKNRYSLGFGPWVLCLLWSAETKKSLGDHWITAFYSVASYAMQHHEIQYHVLLLLLLKKIGNARSGD